MPGNAQNAATDTVEFTCVPSWFAAFLVIVPGAIIAQIVYLISINTVPLPLMVLFGIVVVVCGFLAFRAVDAVVPATAELSSEGLTIQRPLGSKTYAWTEIEKVDLVPSPGTLGDNPNRNGAGRIGVGLYLNASKAEREDERADDILFTGTEEDASRLMQIVDRINAFQRQSLGGSRGRTGRVRGGPVSFPGRAHAKLRGA